MPASPQGEQFYLSRLPHGGEFAEDVHLSFGAGENHGAGLGRPEPGALGKLEPVLPRGLRKFIQFAGLGRDAAVAEVAYRSAGRMMVALDDSDGQAVGDSVSGVGQSHNSSTDNDDVGGLARSAVETCGGRCLCCSHH